MQEDYRSGLEGFNGALRTTNCGSFFAGFQISICQSHHGVRLVARPYGKDEGALDSVVIDHLPAGRAVEHGSVAARALPRTAFAPAILLDENFPARYLIGMQKPVEIAGQELLARYVPELERCRVDVHHLAPVKIGRRWEENWLG